MAQDVSIIISAKDNFSSVITTIRNSGRAFNKDMQDMQLKLNKLNNTKAILQVDTAKASKELSQLKKRFQETGDSADEMAYLLANQKYEQARRNLSLVGQAAKQAEREMITLGDTQSKMNNRAGSGFKLSGDAKNALADGAKILGDILIQGVTVAAGSALGDSGGAMVGSILTGAVSGAAIGSMFSPVIGTAIGAALGGIAGAIQGSTQQFEKEDDAFKNYYGEQFTALQEQSANDLKAGSAVAAERETSRLPFTTMFGSDEKASAYLGKMNEMAIATQFSYDELAQMSKFLMKNSYSQEELIDQMTRLGDTSSALGMSNDEVGVLAAALGKMNTSGKIDAGYLEPLLQNGIPAIEYLAKSLDKSGKVLSEETVYDMLSKNEIDGKEAARIISEALGTEHGGAMENQSKTFSGREETLNSLKEEMQGAMGEGYNTKRGEGMDSEIQTLSGETGDKLKGAYSKIGEWKANLENMQGELEYAALESVMSGNNSGKFSEENQIVLAGLSAEYAKAEGDQVGRILAEAQAIAQNEYHDTEGFALEQKSQMKLAESLRNNAALKDSYWMFGYDMGEEFSKGMGARSLPQMIRNLKSNQFVQEHLYKEQLPMQPNVKINWNEIPNLPPDIKEYHINSSFGNPFYKNQTKSAMGIPYIPRDDFLISAHQGERLLTAQEARGYNANGRVQVTVTGNEFHVREEADIGRIAAQMAERLRIQAMVG